MTERYLDFVQFERPKVITKSFRIFNKSNTQLGYIIFWPRWRKYVFQPVSDTILDNSCLQEIWEFLFHINTERKEEMKNASLSTSK